MLRAWTAIDAFLTTNVVNKKPVTTSAARYVDDDRAGLCASCVHAQLVTSSRGSTFYLCRLSFTDPRFARTRRFRC